MRFLEETFKAVFWWLSFLKLIKPDIPEKLIKYNMGFRIPNNSHYWAWITGIRSGIRIPQSFLTINPTLKYGSHEI